MGDCPNFRVNENGTVPLGCSKEIETDDYRRALAEGRVWFVEFCGSEADRKVESQLAGRPAVWQQFPDYGGRPLLRVFHAAGTGSTP